MGFWGSCNLEYRDSTGTGPNAGATRYSLSTVVNLALALEDAKEGPACNTNPVVPKLSSAVLVQMLSKPGNS